MGTRSLTVFEDVSCDLSVRLPEIAVLYRQFDGYISGHGKELAEILAPEGKAGKLVNGISVGSKGLIFNGMGDLAVRVITALKGNNEPGQFYLFPAGTRDCGEDYIYTVYVEKKKLCVRVDGGGAEEDEDPVFEGTAEDFWKYCQKEEE